MSLASRRQKIQKMLMEFGLSRSTSVPSPVDEFSTASNILLYSAIAFYCRSTSIISVEASTTIYYVYLISVPNRKELLGYFDRYCSIDSHTRNGNSKRKPYSRILLALLNTTTHPSPPPSLHHSFSIHILSTAHKSSNCQICLHLSAHK